MRALAGTGVIIRLILRRDRVRIPVWILGITTFLVAVAASWEEIFPTPAERQPRAELMSNPAMMALRGPGHGLDDYTLGVMVAHELFVFGAVAIALMSIFTIVRHTRADEERSRVELVRASVVGRHAVVSAALVVTAVTSVVIGSSIAIGLSASVEALATVGSWTFGMSIAAVGLVFAAVAAVAAQITEHARGASGLGAAVLAAAFVVRAIGDAGDGTLSWLSPLGWSQATAAYVDDRTWPLLISVAFAGLLTAGVFALASRRDLGAGLLRPRSGAPRASPALASAGGLGLRLHRASMTAWAIGLLLSGLAFGAVIGEIEAFVVQNPDIAAFVVAAEGVGVMDAFLGLLVLILTFLATAFAIQVMLRARAEEDEGRAEPLLATALPRAHWIGSHVAIALVGGAVVLLAGCVGLGAGAAIDQADLTLLTRVVGAGLAHVPGMWVIVGVVTVLYGLRPRTTIGAWFVLLYVVLVGLFADLLDLPEGARILSPFDHVPALPGGELSAAPLAVLTVLSIALTGAGVAAFRHRDLAIT